MCIMCMCMCVYVHVYMYMYMHIIPVSKSKPKLVSISISIPISRLKGRSWGVRLCIKCFVEFPMSFDRYPHPHPHPHPYRSLSLSLHLHLPHPSKHMYIDLACLSRNALVAVRRARAPGSGCTTSRRWGRTCRWIAWPGAQPRGPAEPQSL